MYVYDHYIQCNGTVINSIKHKRTQGIHHTQKSHTTTREISEKSVVENKEIRNHANNQKSIVETRNQGKKSGK